jgi:hypothetical protein
MADLAALGLGTVLLVAAGFYLFTRSGSFYEIYSRVLGTGAFPPQGAKRDSQLRFIRLTGILLLVFGALGGVILLGELLKGE